MKIARNPSKAPAELDDLDLVDADVPAAVVCAHCGDADCAGCRNEQTRSGVVAIVAWERPGAPALARPGGTRPPALGGALFGGGRPGGPPPGRGGGGGRGPRRSNPTASSS